MFNRTSAKIYKRGTLLILALLACAMAAARLTRMTTVAAHSSDPPVAVGDSYTVHGQLSVQAPGVLGNDSYTPGGIAFNGIPQAQHGSITLYNNGAFNYSPNSGYTGADVFYYSICDSNWACSNAAVQLNVVNQAPSAVDDTYNVHGQLTVPAPGFLANDSDPDGDRISVPWWVYGSGPIAHGWLTRNIDGSLSYTPNTGFVGTDTFTYSIFGSGSIKRES